MKTRSKPRAKEAQEAQEATISAPTLGPTDENPGKLFVLPKSLSQEARITTLRNPAFGRSARYLYCPENGFFEFTQISAASNSPKSWLMIKDRAEAKTPKHVQRDASQQSGDVCSKNDDYVAADSDMLIATPFDTLFFLLPALHERSKSPQDKLYLSLDDYVDELHDNSKVLRMSLQSAIVRDALAKRLRAVCDAVDAGEEQMFRLSRPKLVQELIRRAQGMSTGGLPTSMEDHFVREALQSPVMNMSGEDSKEDEGQDCGKVKETQTEEDGQLPRSAVAANDDLARLLRVRVAFKFLVTSYLPTPIRLEMETLLASNEYLDFSKLDEYLEHIASVRSEALALRSLSENINRKRALNDDGDEVAAAKAAKKRKQEEEERLKKNESRAMKELKKADTSGMKKLSSFFGKAVPKQASTG